MINLVKLECTLYLDKASYQVAPDFEINNHKRKLSFN